MLVRVFSKVICKKKKKKKKSTNKDIGTYQQYKVDSNLKINNED